MTISEKLRLMDAIKKANDERWERFAAEQKERATA